MANMYCHCTELAYLNISWPNAKLLVKLYRIQEISQPLKRVRIVAPILLHCTALLYHCTLPLPCSSALY